MCEEGWKDDSPTLVCLDVKDGKILWQQPVDHMDAWPAEKAAEGRNWRARNHDLWRSFMRHWNRVFWDNQKHTFAWRTQAEFGALVAQAKKDGFEFGGKLDEEEVDGRKMVKWRRGVSGGMRSRYYWAMGTPEMRKVYDTCNKNRYYWYPGWTSEGPYFGSVMGSVVSDGKFVYAVTALDAAACFDLDGKRQWVMDFEGQHVVSYPASAPGIIQNHMSSPVLAGDKLVYYHRDAGVLYAIETATGKLAWKLPSPRAPGSGKYGTHALGHVGGHMVPGGTPVLMQVGDTPFVVTASGLAATLRDGRYLGHVLVPSGDAPAKKTGTDDGDAGEAGPAASYTSWVAQGDTLFAIARHTLAAIRLGVRDGKLTQQVRWQLQTVDGRDPNPAVLGGRVYAKLSQDKRRGVAGIDMASGKVLAMGPVTAGLTTSMAFAGGQAVWRTADYTGGVQDTGFAGIAPGKGMSVFTVVSLPGLKVQGTGHLYPEYPTGELAERHIARLGTPRIAWGQAGTTCWGNRIFIRNNDYLWCIGDPDKPFIGPEALLRKTAQP
jgi:hypothetical protein